MIMFHNKGAGKKQVQSPSDAVDVHIKKKNAAERKIGISE